MPRGRPKKAVGLTPVESPEPNAPTVAVPAAVDTFAVDKVLDEAKGKFTHFVGVGLLPDGNIDVATNNPNYAVLQWLLARGQFELLNHEKQNYLNKGKGA